MLDKQDGVVIDKMISWLMLVQGQEFSALSDELTSALSQHKPTPGPNTPLLSSQCRVCELLRSLLTHLFESSYFFVNHKAIMESLAQVIIDWQLFCFVFNSQETVGCHI